MAKVTRSGVGVVQMRKNVQAINTQAAEVGFFDTSHYPDGTPVAYVAAIQEFGSGPIPPCPFMRDTITKRSRYWVRTLEAGAKEVLAGRLTASQMLEQIGMLAAGDVQTTISQLTSPALKDSTTYARAHRKTKPRNTSIKPLVDTGVLFASVDSKVVPR